MSNSEIDSDEPLVEPLTRRESEILGLLDQGLSAPEMAERLTVAVSSVKFHTQNIYGKLGVNSKRQALARARALGLLSTPLPAAWPVPASHAPRHNLPLQVTRFFGREREIRQLKTRLAEHRLVTLTGSGGVGKTRLALQVADAVGPQFADGVWLTELARLADPVLVTQYVAASLGIIEDPRLPILDSLTGYLREREVLLVLDNCEHLLAACAQLADRLLRACPRVHLLATSREPLGVAGEVIFGVPSLPFPDAEHLPPIQQLMDYNAIGLFVDRARLVLPDYQATADNAASLARICQRLDGIPLALEMAAGRLRLLSAETLAARLDSAFRVLTGGSRSALPRQQTLRATLDWSYNLLGVEEGQLFQRLSVFAGGFTLEAAEAVCHGEGLAAEQILEWLAALVEKSLVVAEHPSGQHARYRLLEIMRQYAREKLNNAGEAERLRTRHRDYFLLFFETHALDFLSAERPLWMRRLAADLDNLRQALAWSFDDENDIEAGPRLMIACINLRDTPAWPSMAEYDLWCRRAVAWCQDHSGVSPKLFALLLSEASWVMVFSDQQLALAWSKQAVEISRQLGADGKELLRESLASLVYRYHQMDESELSEAPLAEAQALFDEIELDKASALTRAGAQAWVDWVPLRKAAIANAHGQHQEAKRLLGESLQRLTGSAQSMFRFDALRDLGYTCLTLCEYEEARGHFQAARVLADETDTACAIATAHNGLAAVELGQGKLETALDYCRVGLPIAIEIHDDQISALGLEVVAGVRAAQGQATRAARLAGAAQAIWMRPGRKPRPQSSLDTLLPGWQEGPDAPEIAAAFAAGRAMSVEVATDFALNHGQP